MSYRPDGVFEVDLVPSDPASAVIGGLASALASVLLVATLIGWWLGALVASEALAAVGLLLVTAGVVGRMALDLLGRTVVRIDSSSVSVWRLTWGGRAWRTRTIDPASIVNARIRHFERSYARQTLKCGAIEIVLRGGRTCHLEFGVPEAVARATADAITRAAAQNWK